MSSEKHVYTSKPVDANGIAHYTEAENAVWHELITRQRKIVPSRACDEYLRGLELLNLPMDHVPQCADVSAVLRDTTGWALEPVPAMISFEEFFKLLAERRFPVTTFIRIKEELDYLKEPDIFHEVFGHSPLLTNPAYAAFSHEYGRLGLTASDTDRVMLARLFWFTVEFGLINTTKGIRAYGGGILSSIGETVYAIDSEIPERRPFDPIEALRTSYRVDVMQPIYYVLDSFDQLFHLIDMDLMKLIHQAKNLGEHPPKYPC